MKILHVGKYFPPFHGGIENFMYSLMEQQILDGHQVTAIVHHHTKKKSFSKELMKGSNIYRVPIWGQIVYAPLSPSFGFHLQKIIQEEKPDFIHIHTPNLSAYWCLLFFSVRKIPWVIQWQSDVVGAIPDIKVKILYPFYRFFEKALLNKARKVIVATPPYAATSKALKPFLNKVDIIPLGLPEIYSENKGRRNLSGGSIKLVIVGRLTYYKGHEVFLKALSMLNTKEKYYHLTIVGNGELKNAIVRQIAALNLSKQVTLVSGLSDIELQEIVFNSDVLCLPSIERTEAFGVVLLEAMRASKPCLVSDVSGSGMSWVVQDNKTGFVVKHNNISSLVDKLTYIYQNKELLNIYGEAGRRRFEHHFSISSVSQKITTLYQECLSN